jgi:uncharacterized secreted protein with C-terminal beta-propeller domain
MINNSLELYYIAPSDEIFEEVKVRAIQIWKEIAKENLHPGYLQEKLERIENLENISDNMMYIVAMFDMMRQVKLFLSVSPKTREAIFQRLPKDYFSLDTFGEDSTEN